MTDPIVTFTDQELDRMIGHAYWSAVRSIREARQHQAEIVQQAARSDVAYYEHLLQEKQRRLQETT